MFGGLRPKQEISSSIGPPNLSSQECLVAGNPFDDPPSKQYGGVGGMSLGLAGMHPPQSHLQRQASGGNAGIPSAMVPMYSQQRGGMPQSAQMMQMNAQGLGYPHGVPLGVSGMLSGRVYPVDQPIIFSSTNPNAPPIFACGGCHKEIHENDQAIQCEAGGCKFWYHQRCSGLTEDACHMIKNEPCAEWICDNCCKNKVITWIKHK